MYPQTQQEIYDTVMEHLWNQGKQSLSEFYCFYRGPDNTKCAIGCLIPDKLYKSSMEKKNVYDVLSVIEDNDLFTFLRNNVSFLRSLQDLHDDYNEDSENPHNNFRKYLRETSANFAADYNLKPYKFPTTQV